MTEKDLGITPEDVARALKTLLQETQPDVEWVSPAPTELIEGGSTARATPRAKKSARQEKLLAPQHMPPEEQNSSCLARLWRRFIVMFCI